MGTKDTKKSKSVNTIFLVLSNMLLTFFVSFVHRLRALRAIALPIR